jgi:hypothetical protein
MSAALSPDGRFALVGYHDGKVKLWRLRHVDGDLSRGVAVTGSFA